MHSNYVLAFFIGQLLIGVIDGYGCRKLFALSGLHPYNMLIYATEEAMSLLREFKDMILEVRNAFFLNRQLEISCHAIIVFSRTLGLMPCRLAITQSFYLLLDFL